MFRFDGREVTCEPGDTIASALHRQGILEISRSMKYHRPRGVYCNTGSCAGCFVAVDAVPNVPACMVAAPDGAEVESQNRIGSAKRDLLAVSDKVYRGGFDPHAAFTRPRILNAAFLKAVRFMSGVGRVPEAPPAAPRAPAYREVVVDELVVGAGAAGLLRARQAADGARRVVVVDELEAPGGSALWDPLERETRALAQEARSWPGVSLWMEAVAFGVYGERVAVAHRGDLVSVRATRITVAPGRHDGWPLFPNNDLPGVMSLRGAKRMHGRHGVLPGRRIAVHGRLGDDVRRAFEAAGARIVAQGEVEAAAGGTRVEKARLDGTWHPCDAIVCDHPGTPRVELFQQAGCDLAFRDGALAPKTDADGRTSRRDIHWGRN